MLEFGMNGWALLLGGVVVVIFEVLFPSAGLLGLLAGALLLGGGWMAARAGGTQALLGYSLMTLLLVPIGLLFAFKILPRTPMGRRMILKGTSLSERAATEEGLGAMVGKMGVAESPLRPAGIATIGGRRVDVVTRGVHVDAGTTVRVVKVEGNRVIVEAAPDAPPTA